MTLTGAMLGPRYPQSSATRPTHATGRDISGTALVTLISMVRPSSSILGSTELDGSVVIRQNSRGGLKRVLMVETAKNRPHDDMLFAGKLGGLPSARRRSRSGLAHPAERGVWAEPIVMRDRLRQDVS